MSGLPWFQFYSGDWLSGTRGLSAVETGIYITLIASMYDRGSPLPQEHDHLARLCGASPRQFKSALKILLSDGKIEVVEGGLWNARAAEEMQLRAAKSLKAKQSIDARWNEKEQQKQSEDDTDVLKKRYVLDTTQKSESDTEEERKKVEATPPSPVAAIVKKITHSFDMEKALEAWNHMASTHGLPKVQNFTAPRKAKLLKRLEGWQAAMDKIAQSPFLTGDNDRGWKADFDFVLQQASFTKLMEGKYDGQRRPEKRLTDREGWDMVDRVLEEAVRRENAGSEGFG
jgi:uncharacterized protein YdaU (DUF1376 family)